MNYNGFMETNIIIKPIFEDQKDETDSLYDKKEFMIQKSQKALVLDTGEDITVKVKKNDIIKFSGMSYKLDNGDVSIDESQLLANYTSWT